MLFEMSQDLTAAIVLGEGAKVVLTFRGLACCLCWVRLGYVPFP